jgi:3-phenylpropionate/cinnamic acid dioxygenase small subunit
MWLVDIASMSLSADDRLEIHDLYARYAHGFDQADAEARSALFTQEGSFAHPGMDPVLGTDALKAFIVERSGELPGMRHLIANVAVEETPRGAAGRAYFCCFRLGGDGALRMRNFGRYDDELRRHENGWRIAVRQVTSELPGDLVDQPFTFG